MSKSTAIKMIKAEMSNYKDFDMIGFKREYLEKIISELEDPQNDNSWTVEYGRPHRDACQDAILCSERQRVESEKRTTR